MTFIWRSRKNVFGSLRTLLSILRRFRRFELLCATLLRRRVTELSNLCGLAQVRAEEKNRCAIHTSRNVLASMFHEMNFKTNVPRKLLTRDPSRTQPLLKLWLVTVQLKLFFCSVHKLRIQSSSCWKASGTPCLRMIRSSMLPVTMRHVICAPLAPQ